MMLSGWGRHPRMECTVSRPRDLREILTAAQNKRVIARGNGRAYGDSALNPAGTIDMRGFSRILAFDQESGRVVAESGVLLADIIATFLPRGWFPAVTPGTKFVTIGGMIAADVHGKNHHKHGSFASFLDWMDVLCADGEVRRASRDENAELFHWTTGGMGLTGIILRAGFRLTPVETGWIRQRTVPARDLSAAMTVFEAEQAATYSVAWIDCLSTGRSTGRSLVMLGEHALAAELAPRQKSDPFAGKRRAGRRIPFDFPGFVLGPLTVKAFNTLYYHKGAWGAGEKLVDFDSYFYPLDAILEWNRIYGRRGFGQFQCVIPLAAAKAGLEALLAAIAKAGQGSFLAVLKRMGPQQSCFSFPMEGYTLALDFPVRRDTARLFAELERIAIDHGGRFYLAKDSFLTADRLRAADPRTPSFGTMRRQSRSIERFCSAQSERLDI